MKRFLAVAGLMMLALATPAHAEKVTVQARPDYKGMWASFDGKSSRFDLYAGLHEINGKAAVCGLIFFGDQANGTTRVLEKKRSKHVQYLVDGRPLVIHVSDFIRYDSEAEARKSGKAGCTVTRKAWSDIKDPKSFKLGLPAGGAFTY